MGGGERLFQKPRPRISSQTVGRCSPGIAINKPFVKFQDWWCSSCILLDPGYVSVLFTGWCSQIFILRSRFYFFKVHFPQSFRVKKKDSGSIVWKLLACGYVTSEFLVADGFVPL